MAVKSIIEEVKKGKKIVIFPEGRITTTGALMKVYPGPAVIADKAGAPILPICIEGSQYSVFGRFSKKFKKRPNSKITVNILPARELHVTENLFGKQRRLDAASKLYDIMCDMKFSSFDLNKTVFESLADAYRLVGGDKVVLEDIARKPISFKKLMTSIFALGGRFEKETTPHEYVGLMLPNSVAAVAAFMSLTAFARVPAMINFSGGFKNISAACAAAQIKTIYTSKLFVSKANLQDTVDALSKEGIHIRYMEDVAGEISLFDKIKAVYKARHPLKYALKAHTDDAAVVLFTSGSEGLPKGVVLSHKNIQSNRMQIASIVDFGLLDSFFNAMPIFHSFGLTGGLLLPLLGGIKVFLYPSPLHYRIVPELIYDTNSTVMFGTDTFLNGYAKVAHPYDFHTIRFAVAGAEKVKDETFRIWSDRFGIRIFEGYGATETAPVLSINLPMNFKRGTVGRLLPGIESKLEHVPGVDVGGRLFIKGPNIMKGYLKADAPGILQPLPDGWYDTGDIVDFDGDGFVRILGRAKRFAKVAGEMISLTAVESAISQIWKDAMHAIVAIADDKKGEQLVLYTTEKEASRNTIAVEFKRIGMSELAQPKVVLHLPEMPVMGTGKTDYVKLNEMAKNI
jgi:acyl-[acyl-carrier-protein]-phospholipid O-acyltransferase/long-chain-fatty-acid--[acyl-carrier-protein] ligase